MCSLCGNAFSPLLEMTCIVLLLVFLSEANSTDGVHIMGGDILCDRSDSYWGRHCCCCLGKTDYIHKDYIQDQD